MYAFGIKEVNDETGFENIIDSILNIELPWTSVEPCNNRGMPIVCLLGDFNAHTKNANEYVDIDNHILNACNIANDDQNLINKLHILEECNVSLLSYSKDNDLTVFSVSVTGSSRSDCAQCADTTSRSDCVQCGEKVIMNHISNLNGLETGLQYSKTT
ncbi:unnamed protein product [Mytilus edulis]|uniref:Endonuclease/exonuclease/phosphatase domain-containing protein n=1 Tax=Mytilus edulis TaxID=6550 RepID=A0A8S3QBX7_MYTED|nr:unnamed protein product [Mytilus edulis]